MAPRRLSLFSTIVTKLLLGLTGVSLVAFLSVHLLGNLLLYAGPASFNAYAHALITSPIVIPAEIGLTLLFVIHMFEAVTMWISNRMARPVRYAVQRNAGGRSRKSLASTTMILTGSVTGVFLMIHIATMKYGAWYQTPGGDARDLYRLVAETFANPGWAVFYAVCMVVVGFHLWHGFSSAFESLGLNHPTWTPLVVKLGRVVAIVLGAGFVSIPIWMFLFGGRS